MKGKALRLISILVVFSCTACITQVIEDAIADGIKAKINPPDPDEVSVNPRVEISSVIPARGSTRGGDLVEIVGFGFEPGMQVRFGSEIVDADFMNIQPNMITCTTPMSPMPEFVTVRVIYSGQAAVLPNAFEYYDPVEISAITPNVGPSAGGTLVAIVGKGFIPSSVVSMGDTPVDATVIDGNTITLSSPPLAAGTYSVKVASLNGSDTIPSGFRVFEPVRVSSVAPFAGPLSGGTAITVFGAGFVNSTSLKINGQDLGVESIFDEIALRSTTVLANPPVEGAVPVAASNVNGTHALADAFVFYDPNDPTPRVIAVSPNTGLVDGGREVNIVLGGFTATQGVDVYFGTAVASDCSVTDDYSVTCMSPASAGEGMIDITVQGGGQTAVSVNAFSYIDLQLAFTFPSVGAIAGGTYVELIGNGFGPDSTITFGGLPAVDVDIFTSGGITLRTPPGAVGSVDVRIETQGVTITAVNAFDYYNPQSFDRWTWGGSIDGSVNVTIIDGGQNPVANAFVMIDTTIDLGANYRFGFTNDRGQLTLSGPEIQGVHTIHAGKAGYGAYSWVEVNARNLTMLLSTQRPPPPDPLPECGQPGSSVPPLIRGTVRRIKDEYNGGNDHIIVTTTYRNFSEPLPNPGLNAQLTQQGDFELMARTGDLMVVALAGTITTSNTLQVHSMGFHPFLFAEPSSGDLCETTDDCVNGERCTPDGQGSLCMRIYDNIDIVIDTPLDQPMVIDYINPPLKGGTEVSGPDTTIAFIWYDFGYQGLHPMYYETRQAANRMELNMPARIPEMLQPASFSISAGVYATVQGRPYPPWSEVFIDELTDPSQPVEISPMLKTQMNTSLTPSVGNPMHFGFDLRPADLPDVAPTGNLHILYDVDFVVPCEGSFPVGRTTLRWIAASPGYVKDFDLPVFPPMAAGANIPEGDHWWQMEALYSPEALSFDNMDFGSFLDWDSRALVVDGFSTP